MAQKKAELTIRCGDQPGRLAEILELLAGQGVNVLAFSGYGGEGEATLAVVPDDAHKATAALKEADVAFESDAVLAVKGASGVGDGARLARKLADANINIRCTYASTTGMGESVVVFKVENVEQAARVLG